MGKRTAAGGEHGLHDVQSGRLSDKPEIRRAEARVPHDPRAGTRGICALGRDAPQYVFKQPRAAGRGSFAAQGAQRVFCGADHGL